MKQSSSRHILAAAILLGIIAAAYALRPDNHTRTGENYTGIDVRQLMEVDIPADIPQQKAEYTSYSLSFNKERHTPNYVAWELLASETEGPAPRAKKFWKDKTIAGCPDSRDYSRSGFDRGHMIPAADQHWSHEAMQECFSMANICPQNRSLNSGAWATLESKCRSWAEADSAIIIIAGPIYTSETPQTIGNDTKIDVPDAFFKIIFSPFATPQRAIAFIYPNMPAPGNMRNYVATVDMVEQITGFDFFSALPDSIETEIEAVANFSKWK